MSAPISTYDGRAMQDAQAPDDLARTRLRTIRSTQRRRTTAVIAGGALVAATLFLVSLAVGDLPVPMSQVVATLLGRGDEMSTLVLVEFRLPRLVLGALIGVAFALSGGLFQTVLRNPLASPDIIGITQGASVGAVFALLTLGLSGVWVSVSALAGAGVVASVNCLLAWRDGITGYRFVLCGIGLAFMASSVLGYLLTRSDVRDAQAALVWLAGSVGAADWTGIARLGLVLLVLVPLALALGPALAMLAMGDDAASALGLRTNLLAMAAIAVGVALAAVATAVAGPVAFVALTAAPIARRLVGGGGVALVPTALVGVVVVLGADLAAQHLIPGVQVPVGIMTGIVGGPYLLWLLATSRSEKGSA